MKYQLSNYAEKYFKSVERINDVEVGHDQRIKVSKVLSKIAYFYELVRNTVEYKGVYILRRNAIIRILERNFILRPNQSLDKTADSLIRELIWARYIKNDFLAKSITSTVFRILKKYQLLYLSILDSGNNLLSQDKLRKWVFGIAACEIEECLDPSSREAIVELMYAWFNDHFTWKNDKLDDHEKSMQIYLAIQRALGKSDDIILTYQLLLNEFPDWKNAKDDDIKKYAANFSSIFQEVNKHINNPYRLKMFQLIRRYTPPFQILKKYVENNENLNLDSSEKLEEGIRFICADEYKSIGRKIRIGIVRSVIYIFISKVTLALLIEIPYELYSLGEVRIIPIAINITLPPVLMAILGITISPPGDKNTDMIISHIKTIIYKNKSDQKVEIVVSEDQRTIVSKSFLYIYLVLFGLVFGGVSLLLLKLNFTILGMMIFFMFISLILLFGLRVKSSATQLTMIQSNEGILSQLFDNITLPFIDLGDYLSRGLSKLSVLFVVMDILIEAPLKSILNISEEWFGYVKNRKNEVVDIPE